MNKLLIKIIVDKLYKRNILIQRIAFSKAHSMENCFLLLRLMNTSNVVLVDIIYKPAHKPIIQLLQFLYTIDEQTNITIKKIVCAFFSLVSLLLVRTEVNVISNAHKKRNMDESTLYS